MAKKDKNAVRTAGKLQKKVPGKPFVKGEDSRRNIKGRQPGNRDFYTDFKSVLKRIKDKSTEKSISDEDILFAMIQRALSTSDRLLEKVVDRIYGKVPENINLNGNLDIDDGGSDAADKAIDDFLAQYQITKK